MSERIDSEVAVIVDCPCCNSRLVIPKEEGPVINLTHGYNDKPLALPSWSLGDLVTLMLVGTSIIAFIVLAALAMVGGSSG